MLVDENLFTNDALKVTFPITRPHDRASPAVGDPLHQEAEPLLNDYRASWPR